MFQIGKLWQIESSTDLKILSLRCTVNLNMLTSGGDHRDLRLRLFRWISEQVGFGGMI